MKGCFSNLAWDPVTQDTEILPWLAEQGVEGLEVCPSKVCDLEGDIDEAKMLEYKAFVESFGLQIVAFQSILFGKPHFQVFGDEDMVQEIFDYLEKVMQLAQMLRAKNLVFGSPQNRDIGDLASQEAWKRGVEFFHALGEKAVVYDTCVCLEANPEQYGCNFITNTVDAFSLVQEVGSPGFGLHLDTGGMILSGESVDDVSEEIFSSLKHVHLSAPNLRPPSREEEGFHQNLAAKLRGVAYEGYISIEMLSEGDQKHMEEPLELLQIYTHED